MNKHELLSELTYLEKELHQLRTREQLFHSILEHSEDGILLAIPETGEIVESNTAAQRMLGRTAEELRRAGRRGIVISDERLRNAIKDRSEKGKWRGQLDLVRSNGEVFPVEITVGCFTWHDNTEMISLSFRDITERKKIERQQEFTIRVMNVLNNTTELRSTVHEILLVISEIMGVEAIGIRLIEGEDYPYFEASGFTQEFILCERTLCSYDETGQIMRDTNNQPVLECMCGNILRGRTDPAYPFFTAGGSFWTNSTSELLAATTDAERQARTRNRCNGEGYESVALIPIKSSQKTIGLVQLNDRRPGCFTLYDIEFLERIAASFGIAVERERTAEFLADSERRYRRIVETSNEGFWGVDQEFMITFMNERAEEALGYTHGELLGKNIAVITFPEDWEAIERKKKERRTGIPERFELRLRRKDGSVLWVLQTSTPVMDDSGCFQGSFSMITDISGFKAAQQELSLKSKSLEEMNNALTVLLKKREDDRMELEKSIMSNLKELVFPYVDRLKRGLMHSEFRDLLEILERNLDEIASPFMQRMAYSGLTPREVEVASLIKQHASTKEIAAVLGISIRAAETHRYNIRKKLGLNCKKSSLQSFLKLQNT